VALADQEAKINLLRERSRGKKPILEGETSEPPRESIEFVAPTPAPALNQGKPEHVNFFNDLESGKYVSTKVNTEHVKEKKEEQEKYEKQIGYLTYLGQDTNEATGKRDWYDVAPRRKETLDESGQQIEVSLKSKLLLDPMKIIEKYVGPSMRNTPRSKPAEAEVVKKYEPIIDNSFKAHRKKRRRSSSQASEQEPKRHKKSKKKKHKKDKKKSKKLKSKSPSSDSSEDEEVRRLQKLKVEKLRAERLLRERVERDKADKLLAKLRGDPEPDAKVKAAKEASHQNRSVKQKYNSQFNPEIARQNYD
jgi:hypothetical protein